jgi:hypothetical protein
MCTKSDLHIPTGYEYWEDYCAECERKAADRLFIETVQANVRPKDVLKIPKGTGYVELMDTYPRIIWGHRLYALKENVDGDLLLVEVVD